MTRPTGHEVQTGVPVVPGALPDTAPSPDLSRLHCLTASLPPALPTQLPRRDSAACTVFLLPCHQHYRHSSLAGTQPPALSSCFLATSTADTAPSPGLSRLHCLPASLPPALPTQLPRWTMCRRSGQEGEGRPTKTQLDERSTNHIRQHFVSSLARCADGADRKVKAGQPKHRRAFNQSQPPALRVVTGSLCRRSGQEGEGRPTMTQRSVQQNQSQPPVLCVIIT